jgi:uncharacterized membrane protein YphA (DoxX/SURF4 family)
MRKIIEWILSFIAAVILLQTLFYKFSASEESVYIFTTIGLEPWGRIVIGVLEGIAGLLLIVPKSRLFGAILSIGLMSGALFFHFTSLGIEVMGDGGQIFLYSCLVLICSLIIVFFRKLEIVEILKKMGIKI